MRKFLILLILFCPLAFGEDVATYSGATYTGCRSIGDTNIFLNNPNDYETIKDGYVYLPDGCGSLPQVSSKYLKYDNGIVEMSQAEKDAIDAAEAQVQEDADNAAIDDLRVEVKEVFTAWVQLYNEAVPAQYQITKAMLIQRIKDNR